MERGITDKEKMQKVYIREEKRFIAYCCTRRKYKDSRIKHLQFIERFRWAQTKKHFKTIAPVIHLLSKRIQLILVQINYTFSRYKYQQ